MEALSKDVAIILVPIVTIILGIIIGWLGQRSGFCSIGGIRDFILFRQTRFLKGYIGLIVSAFVFYLIFSLLVPSAFPKFIWLLQEGQLFTAIPEDPEDFPSQQRSSVCSSAVYSLVLSVHFLADARSDNSS